MLEGNVSRKRIEVLKDAADANEVPGVSIELFKVANMGGDSVTEGMDISDIPRDLLFSLLTLQSSV